MITSRQLASVLIALALGSTPLLAQPAPKPTEAKPAQEPKQTAPAPATPAAPQQTEKSTAPDKRKDSPFDYRSSEEISEDVPVSFPVDI